MNLDLLGIFLETEEEKGPLINDQTLIVLMVIGGCVLAAVLIVAFVVWLPKFQQELKHVNLRIEQSISERERQHYLRRRRRLWLSLIPFVKYKYR